MDIRFSNSSKSLELLGVVFFEGDKKIKAEYKIDSKKFDGKSGQTYLVASSSQKTLLIGLGKKESLTLQKARIAAAKLLAQAKSLRLEKVGLALDNFSDKFSVVEIIGAVVEGVRLSDYDFSKYKSKPSPRAEVKVFEITSKKNISGATKAVEEAEKISQGVYFTRNLANEPANVMTPPHLAKMAKEMAAKNNLTCKVLGLAEITRLKMGGILGVAQGSSYSPQLVILENKVKSNKAPIVLVGKGVCFDTGGISIKPAGDMDKMKFDMCGAAAVMGAMKVIANLKIPVKVIGITPLVENMPGSKAQRPGDIVKISNGKTVEVLNTDAEGRLILADALSYAQKFKPRAIVDIATLTGACAATFGNVCSGVMGTDEDLVKQIIEVGQKVGEKCWELPLWDEYGDLIKATYADIQNISKKSAGAITAGMFLKEFAEPTKTWAHLDIAGTAWNDGGPKILSPIGATGVGVRLFVELVKNYS